MGDGVSTSWERSETVSKPYVPEPCQQCGHEDALFLIHRRRRGASAERLVFCSACYVRHLDDDTFWEEAG